MSTGITGFQFQNGTIKRQQNHQPVRFYTVFQFQNGTIKRARMTLILSRVFSFQFQNGTIKSLKLDVRKYYPSVFQFQNGTIKRKGSSTTIRRDVRCFNSKMVRLKAVVLTSLVTYKVGFNSKMVRLKVLQIILVLIDSWCFNSKMVRLKVLPWRTTEACAERFQFQNGTIKSFVMWSAGSNTTYVSIPKWYD